MKKLLQHLFEHKTLPRAEARQVMLGIAEGCYNDTELAAFLTVYLMRSISIDELTGFRDGLLELALPADLSEYRPIDIVGTGGDGKNTFNISTLACLVVAGTGTKVAKHGNYGASSVSGASNVMEMLGYRFTNEGGQLRRELDGAGFTFLHAPLFHPALKAVAGIRRNLGLRTFFNMLGPLVNPARPAYQLIGVYSPELLRIYNYLLQQQESGFTLIHGLDGYDEVSLTNDTKVITPAGERVCSAVELGKRTVLPSDISGGSSVEEAAAIFRKILKGEGTWAQNAVVLANAALSLHGSGGFVSYDDAYEAAVESLESGRAQGVLDKLISLQ
ncbi:MAG: anthranilate phosphoribosyltransferase [Chitinophagaceae bacterium]|nr:MAG: anthranilate phosphoribosyltransferase [Chitinophagaceae bacterium]